MSRYKGQLNGGKRANKFGQSPPPGGVPSFVCLELLNEFKKLNVYKWKYTTFDLFVAVSRVALSLTSSKKCFPAKAWVTRRKRRKGEIIFFRMTCCQFWSFESDGLVSESDRKGWRQLGSLQREALLRKLKNQLNSLPRTLWGTFLLYLYLENE